MPRLVHVERQEPPPSQEPASRSPSITPSRSSAAVSTRTAFSCRSPWVTPGLTISMHASCASSTDLVDGELRRGELAVHRPRARDVGGVPVDLAASVDQNEVAALRAPRVLVIVQDARVDAARDDRVVAVALAARAAKRRLEHRLQLVLRDARPREAHRGRMSLCRDVGCTLHRGELQRVLPQTQLGELGTRILQHGMSWQVRAHAPAFSRERRKHLEQSTVELGITTEAHEHARVRPDQLGQLRPELVRRERFVDAELADGAADTVTATVPDLALRVAGQHEQHRVHAVPAVSPGDERRVGLVEPRQVEDVGVLTEVVLDVVVAEGVCGRHEHGGGLGPRRSPAGARGARRRGRHGRYYLDQRSWGQTSEYCATGRIAFARGTERRVTRSCP